MPRKKSSTKSNGIHDVLLIGITSLLHTVVTYICLVRYLNPVYVIRQRQARIYHVTSQGRIKYKPRFTETIADLFRSETTINNRLLDWARSRVPRLPPDDLTSSWHDGIVLCNLIEVLCPGSCTRHDLLRPHHRINNCRLGLRLAQKEMGMPQDIITAEEMATASQQTESKIRDLLHFMRWYERHQQHKQSQNNNTTTTNNNSLDNIETNVKGCTAKGSGLSTGSVGKRAKFYITTKANNLIDLQFEITGPNQEYCSETIKSLYPNRRMSMMLTGIEENTLVNVRDGSALTPIDDGTKFLEDKDGTMLVRQRSNQQSTESDPHDDHNLKIPFDYQCVGDNTYMVSYIPRSIGIHTMTIKYFDCHITGSPFTVNVHESPVVSRDSSRQKFILPTIQSERVQDSVTDSTDVSEIDSGLLNVTGKKRGKGLTKQRTVTKRRVLKRVVTHLGKEVDLIDLSSRSPSVSGHNSPSYSRQNSPSLSARNSPSSPQRNSPSISQRNSPSFSYEESFDSPKIIARDTDFSHDSNERNQNSPITEHNVTQSGDIYDSVNFVVPSTNDYKTLIEHDNSDKQNLSGLISTNDDALAKRCDNDDTSRDHSSVDITSRFTQMGNITDDMATAISTIRLKNDTEHIHTENVLLNTLSGQNNTFNETAQKNSHPDKINNLCAVDEKLGSENNVSVNRHLNVKSLSWNDIFSIPRKINQLSMLTSGPESNRVTSFSENVPEPDYMSNYPNDDMTSKYNVQIKPAFSPFNAPLMSGEIIATHDVNNINSIFGISDNLNVEHVSSIKGREADFTTEIEQVDTELSASKINIESKVFKENEIKDSNTRLDVGGYDHNFNSEPKSIPISVIQLDTYAERLSKSVIDSAVCAHYGSVNRDDNNMNIKSMDKTYILASSSERDSTIRYHDVDKNSRLNIGVNRVNDDMGDVRRLIDTNDVKGLNTDTNIDCHDINVSNKESYNIVNSSVEDSASCIEIERDANQLSETVDKSSSKLFKDNTNYREVRNTYQGYGHIDVTERYDCSAIVSNIDVDKQESQTCDGSVFNTERNLDAKVKTDVDENDVFDELSDFTTNQVSKEYYSTANVVSVYPFKRSFSDHMLRNSVIETRTMHNGRVRHSSTGSGTNPSLKLLHSDNAKKSSFYIHQGTVSPRTADTGNENVFFATASPHHPNSSNSNHPSNHPYTLNHYTGANSAITNGFNSSNSVGNKHKVTNNIYNSSHHDNNFNNNVQNTSDHTETLKHNFSSSRIINEDANRQTQEAIVNRGYIGFETSSDTPEQESDRFSASPENMTSDNLTSEDTESVENILSSDILTSTETAPVSTSTDPAAFLDVSNPATAKGIYGHMNYFNDSDDSIGSKRRRSLPKNNKPPHEVLSFHNIAFNLNNEPHTSSSEEIERLNMESTMKKRNIIKKLKLRQSLSSESPLTDSGGDNRKGKPERIIDTITRLKVNSNSDTSKRDIHTPKAKVSKSTQVSYETIKCETKWKSRKDQELQTSMYECGLKPHNLVHHNHHPHHDHSDKMMAALPAHTTPDVKLQDAHLHRRGSKDMYNNVQQWLLNNDLQQNAEKLGEYEVDGDHSYQRNNHHSGNHGNIYANKLRHQQPIQSFQHRNNFTDLPVINIHSVVEKELCNSGPNLISIRNTNHLDSNMNRCNKLSDFQNHSLISLSDEEFEENFRNSKVDEQFVLSRRNSESITNSETQTCFDDLSQTTKMVPRNITVKTQETECLIDFNEPADENVISKQSIRDQFMGQPNVVTLRPQQHNITPTDVLQFEEASNNSEFRNVFVTSISDYSDSSMVANVDKLSNFWYSGEFKLSLPSISEVDTRFEFPSNSNSPRTPDKLKDTLNSPRTINKATDSQTVFEQLYSLLNTDELFTSAKQNGISEVSAQKGHTLTMYDDVINGETLCRATGSGLYHGSLSRKNNFQVHCQNAGNGILTVGIRGPRLNSVSETSILYTGDNLYEVTFEVTIPGFYVINIRWSDATIPGSPYICKVTL